MSKLVDQAKVDFQNEINMFTQKINQENTVLQKERRDGNLEEIPENSQDNSGNCK